MVEKNPEAFRTISEVSVELGVPQHVLRFWETKFPQLRPMKRAGNRRYYRPQDMRLLLRIRDLLQKEGYTVRGVQQLLRTPGFVASLEDEPPPAPIDPRRKQELSDVLSELTALRDAFRAKAG